MNETKRLLEEKKIKPKQTDIPKIRSIIDSAEEGVNAAISVPLTEQTATMIFKEIYDSIRKIGDTEWLLQGYEAWNHEISIDKLIKENTIEYQNLDQFRRLRNDAQYRGYKINQDQTKDIIAFWKQHGQRLLEKIKQKIK